MNDFSQGARAANAAREATLKALQCVQNTSMLLESPLGERLLARGLIELNHSGKFHVLTLAGLKAAKRIA